MKVPVKVYEEVGLGQVFALTAASLMNLKTKDIEWVDNNGINTPYLVSYIGGKDA